MWAHWLIFVVHLLNRTRGCQVFKLANKDVQIAHTTVVTIGNLEECIEKCRDDNTCMAIETSADSRRCRIVNLEQNKTSQIYSPVDDAYNTEIWMKATKAHNETRPTATPVDRPELWTNLNTTPETSSPTDCSEWLNTVGCHVVKYGPVTWEEAEINCRNWGAYGGNIHQVEIDTLAEKETLVQLMKEKSASLAWIGAKDVNQNNTIQYVTSGNQVPAELWEEEPDHGDGDCVYLDRGDGYLHVEECSTSMDSYICEVFP